LTQTDDGCGAGGLGFEWMEMLETVDASSYRPPVAANVSTSNVSTSNVSTSNVSTSNVR